ncbi:MAG: hypothetical protein ABI831_15045 [Betaproteobacteria bacterium]
MPAARAGAGTGYGRAARTMFDPRVPSDERRDILGEAYTNLAGELASELQPGQLDQLRAEAFQLISTPAVMAKAVRLEPSWLNASVAVGRPRQHSAILRINEFGIVDSPDARSRWFEKPGINGFTVLRDMANVDLLAAIDLTFMRQALRFFRPERDEIPQGIRIARVDGEKIQDGEKREIARIERMLFAGGDVDDYFERRQLQRSSLSAFVTQFGRDSLAADACPIELTRTNGGKLSGWHSLDYTTFRLCSEYGYEGRDEIGAVQLMDGVPQLAFEQRDFLYEIRNPRTDIRSGGYGFAESEILLAVVTGYLNTVASNLAGIDRNTLPRGIMTMIGKGIFNGDQLETAKRQLTMMMSGAGNRQKFMMLGAEDGPGAVWTPIDQLNEMLFVRLAIFLMAMACAVKGLDPAAIGSDSFSMRTGTLGGSDTEEKLSFSRNKGLLPFLDFCERIPSTLVSLINPTYRVQLVGLHEEDEARKQERIKLSRTWDEIAAIDGVEPHPDPIIGGAPAGNPNMMALYMARVGVTPGSDPNGDQDEEEDDGDATPPKRGAKKRRSADDEEAITKAAVVVIHRNADPS